MTERHPAEGWAETSPHLRGERYPAVGDKCPRCRRTFKKGERLIATGRDLPNGRIEWMHAEHGQGGW